MIPKILYLTGLLLLCPVFLLAQEANSTPQNIKFIENGGQWPSHVNYKSSMPGGQMWLENKGIVYDFISINNFHNHLEEDVHEYEPSAKRMLIYAQFVGCNEVTEPKATIASNEQYGYFLGNDPNKWASGLKAFGHVAYKEIYNGIDLIFFESEGQLKYEYHVSPGGDPSNIKTKYYGESKIEIKRSGNLVIGNDLGEIIEVKPFVYQMKNGKKVEVRSAFKLNEDVVSFELGNYDPALPLIIDPVLVFATYSGAPSDNFGMTATFGHDGSAYSAGMVFGNDYPSPGLSWNDTPNITVFSTNISTTDAFVSKYSADGTSMIWTNFVGGGDNIQGTETVQSLICDEMDNIYLFGVTSSTDFPVFNAYQNTHGGGTSILFNSTGTQFDPVGTDIYLTKLSADGLNLMGSTYLGGSGNDGVNYNVTGAGFNYNGAGTYDSLTYNYADQFRGEIFLDSLNNVFVATCSRSINFPIVGGGVQSTSGGQQDGVVFKMSSDLSTLLWSTYLGGSENDACYSLKLDTNYNVLVGGGTSSVDFPGTAGGLYPTYQGGSADGFIAVLSPDGTSINQSSYYGTPSYDQVLMLETDDSSNVYVIGQTEGAIPVISATYSNPSSGQFISKLNNDLQGVSYSTLVGSGSGIPDISISAFAVDKCENVFFSGWGANILQATPLSGMPVTTDAFAMNPPNGFDFYLFAMERDAEGIIYGSYIGDSNAAEHVDGGTSRFDENGVLYQSVCGGCGGNSGFPTTSGAWSNVNLSTNCNNLVFKFDFQAESASFQMAPTEGCSPLTVDISNTSTDTINHQWIFPNEATVNSVGVDAQLTFNSSGTFAISLVTSDPYCNSTDTLTQYVTVGEMPTVTVSNDTTILTLGAFDIWANSMGSGTNFTWDDDPLFSSPIASGPTDSTITVNPSITTTYYVFVYHNTPACGYVDSVTVTVPANVSLDEEDEFAINIYPNPFDEHFVVESPLEMEAIEILDVQGKLVHSATLKNGFKEIIGTSKFAEGTYVVQITFVNKSVVNRTLVK